MEQPTAGMVAGAAAQVAAAAGLAWVYDQTVDTHRLTDTETCLRLSVPPLVIGLLLVRWALLMPALRPRDQLVLFRSNGGDYRVRGVVDQYRAILYAGLLMAGGALLADTRHGLVASALGTALAAGHLLELFGLLAGERLERAIIQGWRAAGGGP